MHQLRYLQLPMRQLCVRSLNNAPLAARCLSSLSSYQGKAKLVIYDKDGTIIDFDKAWTPWVKKLAQKSTHCTYNDRYPFQTKDRFTSDHHRNTFLKLHRILPDLQKRTFLTQTKALPERTDYIVIGAGSAGCVLANRLTEDKDSKVLLLEAGCSDFSWKVKMPAALMYTLFDPKFNWCYYTEPQKEMHNRVMYWPRGKMLGGCSSHNAMVYIRGHAYDYDRWANLEGATGWSYDECLPYFKRSQTHELGEDDYRGGSGPQFVSRGIMIDSNPLHNAFIEAMQEAGYPFTEDMNGYQQEGVGYMDMTIKKGIRSNTSAAYLDPVRSRQNLQINTKILITQLLIENKKCVGVEVMQGSEKKKIYADREVILSAGAINSPQILMLSGIGDADDLRKLDIPVVQHLPGVGKNLQDHLEVYYQHECTEPITLYKYQWKFPHHMILTGLQWFLNQTGPGATTHLEVGGFIRSGPEVLHPDIQFHFLPSVVINHGSGLGDGHAFQVHVGPMRSKSTGYVSLKSKNPTDYPIMDPRYLSHPDDIKEFRSSVRLTAEIFDQPALQKYRGPLIQPKINLDSDAEIDEFVKRNADSAYHPSCTAKMGDVNDELVVVDPQCRVKGIQGLRVVDASIMPSVVSGNLNGPVIMVAEKAADMIRGVEPLPKSTAKVYKTENYRGCAHCPPVKPWVDCKSS